MKKIVVLAENGWSIGRVHRDVAIHLAEDFEFTFYDAKSFVVENFVADFNLSDLCLTTADCLDEVLQFCHLQSPKCQQKMVVVCHGFGQQVPQKWNPHVTYGVASDVLLPHMSIDPHVVPNGVNESLFDRKKHLGTIKLLGWCGALNNPAKRSGTVFEIARLSQLPVSIAETLPFQDLKDWYHTIDVLLVTSGPEPRHETGPLPPFEAIASGVAVIGTRVGNFAKVPGPKFTTVEEAAAILSNLKSSPEKVRELAEEQYQWVMENWTYRTLAKSWKIMFDSAIANQSRFLDFIEIGTSDFDTEIEKKDDKVGVSIEPIKHYLDRLPNKHGCRKLNVGISNYTGTCEVNFVPEEMIRQLGFPEGVKGCNSINSFHPTVTAMCMQKSVDVAAVTKKEVVPVQTLHKTMETLHFEGVFFLKIDTEGHDAVILKKFFEDFNGDKRLLPHIIQFESNSLISPAAVDDIIEKFQSLGYDLATRGHDTVLRRNLQTGPKTIFSPKIANYFIMGLPPNYRLPGSHANTLESAKEYCVQNNGSGVTFQDGLFQVRVGNYLNYSETDVVSWIYM